MSEDWIEENLLRFEGFSDQDIIEIKTAIPILQQLISLIQKNETDLTHIFLLGKQLLPAANLVATKLKGRFQS